jgi:hypothetical protein
VWGLAAEHAPDHGIDTTTPLVIDLDATLVSAHSEKEQAAATFKRGYGFQPLCAFVDHGPNGTGEPLHLMLRPGNVPHVGTTKRDLGQGSGAVDVVPCASLGPNRAHDRHDPAVAWTAPDT